MSRSGKELFMALRSEASDYAEAYRHVKSLYDVSWNEYMNREAAEYMMVFRRPEEVFVAECSFQGIQKESILLGCEVVAEQRGKGVGTEIVRELIQLAHARFPNRTIEVKIRKGNIASRRVTEKCGGKLIGTEDTPEARYYQKFLDRHNGAKDFDALPSVQELIRRWKDGIVIYEV